MAALEGRGPTIETPAGTVAVAYADVAHGWSVPTICNGRTKGVFKGQTASLAQCHEWLIEDASDAGRSVKRCTTAAVTQRQYDILVSFTLNVGGGNYCASKLVRELNAGNCHAAAREFNAAPQINRFTGQPIRWHGRPIKDKKTGAILLATGEPVKKWTTANGIPLPGLINRRAIERAKFEADCEPRTSK